MTHSLPGWTSLLRASSRGGWQRPSRSFPGQKTNLFQRACWVWRELPVPVIAVVHGHCFGGGLQLALAADFRFTTPDCTFSVMEAKWGLIPDMTGTVTMRELAAMDVVKRLAMTAELFDGNQALEWGVRERSQRQSDQAGAGTAVADRGSLAGRRRSDEDVAAQDLEPLASRRVLDRNRGSNWR